MEHHIQHLIFLTNTISKMTKFILNDKDFESIKSIDFKGKYFELTKFGKDEYILFEHIGDSVGDIYTFTKKELFALWGMLSNNG
jgi:hypothetical protein